MAVIVSKVKICALRAGSDVVKTFLPIPRRGLGDSGSKCETEPKPRHNVRDQGKAETEGIEAEAR